MASGDDAYDKSVEDAIIADGNVWAWASISVAARIGGTECRDYLGCCSYKDEAGFKDGGYYLDMKGEALSGLRDMLEGALERAEKELSVEREAYNRRQGEYENWWCTDCDGCAVVHPDEYAEIGTPYCSDCDQEMERVEHDG
jgi:hypothetical protein